VLQPRTARHQPLEQQLEGLGAIMSAHTDSSADSRCMCLLNRQYAKMICRLMLDPYIYDAAMLL
jgi:hypothetical protein